IAPAANLASARARLAATEARAARRLSFQSPSFLSAWVIEDMYEVERERAPIGSPLCPAARGGANLRGATAMEYLHTMIRVSDLEASLAFFVGKLGLAEVRRASNEKGRYTLVFLAAPGDAETARKTQAPLLELTYNWDPEVYTGGRNFGHLAYAVDDIYATCDRLQKAGVVINRPPRDGRMAFVRSPDNISIELLQKGEALAPAEPWASMGNTGAW